MAWQFDTSHAIVEFSTKHMMVSTVKGRFNTFSGDIVLDENTPANSHVNVTIDAASIDTNSEGRDQHLRSADFFDVAQYPTITFTSKRITEQGRNHFKVYGDLTMHGVTKEVELSADVEGPIKDLQGARRVNFSVATTVNRKDFGLEWNVALESGGWLVSDKVTIAIEAPAIEPAVAAANA